MKYYQKSLGQLADTLSDKEREAVKRASEQFLKQHDYFSEVWKYVGPTQKEKILDTIAAGKGLIPYEKITNQHNFFLTPENGTFFEKTEFFNELKNRGVSDSVYESSFYLYSTLKTRNLGGMNDLYNAQGTILLCEITENRFQLMQDEYGYNPRECNSASTLSGCIEREMSKIIITLPTSSEIIDIFEKTLTGGFSSVNTRLAFDTKTLLPNLSTLDNDGMNILQKDHNYKICYKLKLDTDKDYNTYRIMRKILKLDQNNQ